MVVGRYRSRSRLSRKSSGRRPLLRESSQQLVADVLFVAGEASGDLHAAGVAEELRRIRPELRLTGIGGPRMKSAGVELIAGYDEMAVMGFVEVIRHLPRHFELLSELRSMLQRGRVSLLVLVDYPGFNMKAARAAAEA